MASLPISTHMIKRGVKIDMECSLRGRSETVRIQYEISHNVLVKQSRVKVLDEQQDSKRIDIVKNKFILSAYLKTTTDIHNKDENLN